MPKSTHARVYVRYDRETLSNTDGSRGLVPWSSGHPPGTALVVMATLPVTAFLYTSVFLEMRIHSQAQINTF